MYLLKKPILILAVLMPFLVSLIPDGNTGKKLTGNTSGFINITVESNINRVFFNYNLEGKCISVTDSSSSEINESKSCSRIVVPVKEFKCPSRFVYKDFLTLLKADRFPFLEIDLPGDANIKLISDDSLILRGVSISVAGVSKKYDINCSVEKINSQMQILNGTTMIKLTDLNIDPPVKSFGLVKVRNEIIINFGFCLNDILKRNYPV